LSEQTGVPVVFPYDLVKDSTAARVVGPYTLVEALDALLKDTELSGGLSDKGVLTISEAKSSAVQTGAADHGTGRP
jgi:iron complex outermembrane recepter protein